MNFETIKNHYRNRIVPSEKFDSLMPVRDLGLLLPEFFDTLVKCFDEFESLYPEQKIYVVETYRSNRLQRKYFNEGRSKIRAYGMHHFGIAADVAFLIEGMVSYEGNYADLREIFKNNALYVLDWELCHVQYIPVSQQSDLRRLILNS
ncbi:MAG: hypothetical protein ACP5P3_06595 [Ignavibacteria bacterium]